MPFSTILILVLLVEETRLSRENHQPVASHWQTLSYNVAQSTPHHAWAVFELTMLVLIGTDCIGSCKSNYHMITTTTVPEPVESWSNICQFLYTNCIMDILQVKPHYTISFAFIILTKVSSHVYVLGVSTFYDLAIRF